jgi:NAD(P)-dependent dehydrogenase (short-subunit alcohol dehydrogenase family)
MTGQLKNKTALVTGGTNGIGEAAVYGLVAEGVKVVFTGGNEEAARRINDETGAVFVKHRVQDAWQGRFYYPDILGHCKNHAG